MAQQRIRGIVLDVLKHSDRHNVVTLYTRSLGRVALLSAAGQGKTARLRNAGLMPLSVVEADVNFNPTRELQFLGRFSRPLLWRDIYFNPVKSAIALFISEFLNAFLRQSPPDPSLWDFIIDSVADLDSRHGSTSNFHLAFLIEFLDYAGIRPDLSSLAEGDWFDMRAGTPVRYAPPHRDVVIPDDAHRLPALLRMTRRNAARYPLSAPMRREILTGILHYYAIHFPGLPPLKSPAILADVFA